MKVEWDYHPRPSGKNSFGKAKKLEEKHLTAVKKDHERGSSLKRELRGNAGG